MNTFIQESPFGNTLTKANPFLRWAGSKRKHCKTIAQFWSDEEHFRYLEPFAGSAALFFHLLPSNAILGDLNEDLINVYEQISNDATSVYEQLITIPNHAEKYYHLRSLSPSTLNPVQRAVRFLYLNRYCFNGLYRTNRQGNFNVPYSGKKTGVFPSLQEFQGIGKIIKSTSQLYTGDFETFLEKHAQKNDFVYLDPPYGTSFKRTFHEYGAESFGKDDLDRLQRLLNDLDGIGAKFVFSYSHNTAVATQFKKWNMITLDTARTISASTAHRKSELEALISNIEIP